MNDLLNKSKKLLPVHESAKDLSNDFSTFFADKIKNIYLALGGEQTIQDHLVAPVSNLPTLTDFDLLRESDTRELISKAPNKSCQLDPVPTWFLKENIDTFTPFITQIINSSLSLGIFPSNLKHSIVSSG